ncbi:MAG: bifunctional UDP-sugar hydrolase/5'-nucleotidase [Eubacteriales bacterium]|nr:bifunctional UDP-sugar hydrolase/5'-nucleotidase [Eubacteriales bacterium]
MAFAMPLPSFAEESDKEQNIIILYTNDVHCAIDDNIGYAGLALYEKEMLQETPYVTLVDAGDAIQGAPIGTLSSGSYVVDIMNEVGYDFAIPGNHEFDYGMDRFLALADDLECGYTSCNFMDLKTNEPVLDAYHMFDYGDTSIAFVGVSTPESYTKSTPSYFQDEAGNYIYGFCEDETGKALYDQVQNTVDEATDAGADYVVLVGHLGKEGVTPYWTSDAVIANTTGIDVVIDGHSHESFNRILENKDGDEVILTQTGTKLSSIGKLTIEPDGTITAELVDEVPALNATASAADATASDATSSDATPAAADDSEEPVKNVDPETDAFIKNIQAKYSEMLEEVVGNTSVLLTTNNPDTGERAVRKAETNLGDFCADAFRDQSGADIAFMNGGGIRADVEAGEITYNDLLNVFPFSNTMCVAEVTGSQIRDALEMASKNYPEESGGFLQVSGISYTINSSIPSSVKLDDKGNFTGVEGDYRVTDIKVNGEPLDLEKTYTLASHSYMLKSCGDGMTMFEGCNIIQDDIAVDVDVLSNYLSEALGGTVSDSYANPSGDGRISIIVE